MKLFFVLSFMFLVWIPGLRAGVEQSMSRRIYIPNVPIHSSDLEKFGKEIDPIKWMKYCTGKTFLSNYVPSSVSKLVRKTISWIPLIGRTENITSAYIDVNEKMMEFERLYNDDPKDGYREGKYKSAKATISSSVEKLKKIYRKSPDDNVRDDVEKMCGDMFTCLEYLEAGVYRKAWWKKALIATAMGGAAYYGYKLLAE